MNRKFMAIVVLFVALLWGRFIGSTSAATISLVWDTSPSEYVVGYAVYYGNKSGEHPNRIDAGNRTSLVFQPAAGDDTFFVVTAYNSLGMESIPSNEAVYQHDIVLPQIPSGDFSGLLDVSGKSVGSFTLKKGRRDTFSGTIGLNGWKYRFSGKADSSNTVNVEIKRRGETSLTLTFNGEPSNPDRLTGTLTDGNWLMELNADRATFDTRTNPAPFAGNYTVAIAGILGEDLTPGGIGFASVSVLPNGKIRARGTLGDGKNFSNSAGVSTEGAWPFYVSTYGRQGGSIAGWLNFETSGTDVVHGGLMWIKPAISRSKFYPKGFTNSVALTGSPYISPTGAKDPVLEFPAGTITVSGADLASGYVKDVVSSADKIVPETKGEDRLAIRIQKRTGLFSGSIRVPDVKSPLRFSGALLQNQDAGYGLVFVNDQIGEVALERKP